MISKALVSVSTLFGTLMMGNAFAQTQLTPPVSRYAEGLYEIYQNGSDGGIAFSVATAATGAMTELSGKPFRDLVAIRPYRIESSQSGTRFSSVEFKTPDDPAYGLQDMDSVADRFQDFGLPLSLGMYRKLRVTATIGEDVRSHEALEFCWVAAQHCAVLDPTVIFLQSKAESRLQLVAEGWGSNVTLQTRDTNLANGIAPDSKGKCGLASDPKYIGMTITWKAYSVKYKDVFGITLVEKHLGEQAYGLRCDTSCHPQPFSRSDSSSAWGTGGWTTACDNTGDATGKTGNTARSIGETKCTDKWVESAKASVDIEGKGGASISAKWTLGGSVDSNGGVYTDSCGYF